MEKKGGTPAWVWIGCGCLLCIVLLVGGAVGVGVLGFSWLKGAVDDMADPEARTAKAMKLLGAEQLPAGYHVRAAFSMPFVFDLASLADGEPPPEVEGETLEEKADGIEQMLSGGSSDGDHTFLYIEVRGRQADQEIEDVIGGESSGGTQIDLGLSFRGEQEIGHGSLEVHGHEVEWRAMRGSMRSDRGRRSASWTAIRFHCGDDTPRDALWIEHLGGAEDEPPAESPPAESPPAEPPPVEAPAGGESPVPSVADPQQLLAFLEHFDVCG